MMLYFKINNSTDTGLWEASAKSNAIKSGAYLAFMGEFFVANRSHKPNFVVELIDRIAI
jgi:hypothetical protein